MDPRHDHTEALYRDYLSACNDRRFDDVRTLVHPEVDGAANGETQGQDAYMESIRVVTDAMPDYRWNLDHVVIEDDWIAATLHGTGTHTGEFQGIQPTGRSMIVQELVVYRLDDGRIRYCRGDLHSTLRAEFSRV